MTDPGNKDARVEGGRQGDEASATATIVRPSGKDRAARGAAYLDEQIAKRQAGANLAMSMGMERRPIVWSDLAGKEPPPRDWAIKYWLGRGHVTLLVGAAGIGKTLIAQQIASALALGQRFIDDVSKPLKVLMWGCEDDHDEFWRRQGPIGQWLGVDSLEAFSDNLIIEPRLGRENVLVVSDMGRMAFTPLIEELAMQAGDYGADVVILDNVAQLYGGNENDRHQVTAFMNALIGALPGKAVLLLAHPAKAAGSEFSGSSAWEAVARTRLFLGDRLPDERPDMDEAPADNVRFLARRKANYSAKDWRRFSFKDGVLVPDAAETLGGVVGHIREQSNEKIVLEGLKRLNEMKLWPTEGSNSPRYLPKLMAEHRLGDGRSKSELAAAMRRLMGDGRLVIAEVARYSSNRNPMLGLKATP